MNEITTEKEALVAVRKRGRALQYVPEKLRIAVHYYLNGGD